MATRRNGDRAASRRDMSLFGDIADSELLAIVDDLSDENGWTHALEVRLQLGENIEESGRSGVGPRLSWLRRYGWLERHPDDYGRSAAKRFRLTAMGHALLEHPQLSRSFERVFGGLNPAQRLALTRELGEYGRGAPNEIRYALSRQWRRSVGR